MTPEEMAIVTAALDWHGHNAKDGTVNRLIEACQRLIFSCVECDAATHRCPGCGEDLRHGQHACRECTQRVTREAQKDGMASCDASTFPCWECTIDEDPAPWCDCRREDFGTTHPGHACRLRAHHPANCLNNPDYRCCSMCDEGQHRAKANCPRELIWVERTWTDVRAGDHVRIKLPGAHGGYADAIVYTAVHLPWHVDPRSSEYRPVALEWSEVAVRFESDGVLRKMDPSKPVEIELTRGEAETIALMGWPLRVGLVRGETPS